MPITPSYYIVLSGMALAPPACLRHTLRWRTWAENAHFLQDIAPQSQSI